MVAVAALALIAGCSGADDISGDGGETTPTSQAPSTSTGSTTSTPTDDSPSPTGGLPEGFGDGPPGKGLQRFYDQEVTWSDCGGGDECASIWVPLDYKHPGGQAITIKAKRQPAGDAAKRQGSLFINPGGPGGSGIDYLDFIGLKSQVTDVYDVVGFDPRGVGQSTPIDCISDSDLDTYVASDPTPDNKAEIQRLEQLWTHMTKGCVERSGPLLAHVSTVEAARDIDILRAVVKDKKLNYFGASYGTYLGATYAALFPTKVHRMVLDGAVDPLAKPRKAEIHQAGGFETALTAYLKYCVAQDNCPLGDNVDQARTRLQKLFKELDQHPLESSSGRKLTEGLAFLGVIVPLYNRDNWPYETQALQSTIQGNADAMLSLADAYTERQSDGSYKSNSMEVQSAVNCLDKPEHESVKDIEAGKSDFLEESPTFGPAAMWWPYACSHWPVKASEPHPDYAAKGAPPIVVIGTTRDPATPYKQAVKLAKELSSGVLLSRDGDGHTAYGSGNNCIDSAVDTYLATGKPPDDGTMCR